MKMSKSLGNTIAPAGRDPPVRRRHPAALGGADRLHRRPAHRPGDPEGHRRQLPPAAQHPALPARRARRLRRGRAGRAGGDARARALGAAPPGRARRARCATATPPTTSRACSRACSSSAPSTSRRFYFDIRKDALYCDAATSPRRRAARTVLDALFHRLPPGSRRCSPSPWRRSGSSASPARTSSVHLVDFPATPGRLARPGARREVGDDPPRPPRRHRRARGRAAREAHRRQPRGGAGRPRRRPRAAARRCARVDFADICITSDLTLTDAPGARRRLRARRRPRASRWCRALADGAKCARCWKILPDVGTHAHPGVCARCDAALGVTPAPGADPAHRAAEDRDDLPADRPSCRGPRT